MFRLANSISALLFCLSIIAAPVYALSEQKVQQLQFQIETLQKEISHFKKTAENNQNEERLLASMQVIKREKALREALNKLATYINSNPQSRAENEAIASQVLTRLSRQSTIIKDEISQIEHYIQGAQAASEKASTMLDRMTSNKELEKGLHLLNEHLEALLANATQRQQFGINTDNDLVYLDQRLDSFAIKAVGVLELTKAEIDELKDLLSFAPEDVKKELSARLVILINKRKKVAAILSKMLNIMSQRGLNTASYQHVLISATGQVSGDIFNKEVILDLAERVTEVIQQWFSINGTSLLWKLMLFGFIIALFSALSKLLSKMVQSALNKSKLQLSKLLREFFTSITSKIVLLIGILVAMSQLGVEVTPFLAGLGMVGFIVGFALQDTLSNFASGLMILIYRPFDEGNLIEAAGITGKVSKLSLVSTTILTPDNQILVVPNSKIWGNVIRNVTSQTQRRVDMKFSIGYSDDIPKAEKVLMDILTQHEQVLDTPEPNVKLHTLNESSVDFIVRPWVKTDDYWNVYWDVTRAVKQRFDEEDISIPFPQRDLHIHTNEKPLSESPKLS